MTLVWGRRSSMTLVGGGRSSMTLVWGRSSMTLVWGRSSMTLVWGRSSMTLVWGRSSMTSWGGEEQYDPRVGEEQYDPRVGGEQYDPRGGRRSSMTLVWGRSSMTLVGGGEEQYDTGQPDENDDFQDEENQRKPVEKENKKSFIDFNSMNSRSSARQLDYMIAEDQTIVRGSVPNVVDALMLMFAAYYYQLSLRTGSCPGVLAE
ncbi:hypothetical protein F7725_010833, partial [Dissostichus mawsoni]